MASKEKAKVGRPRKFDSDEMIDAALELFWSNGFGATTTRALETHMGMNQSSLYNAFGSKGALLELAITRYRDRVTSSLLDPLESAGDGLDSLGRFFTELQTWITDDGSRGCLLINLMAEDGGESDGVSAHTQSYRKRMRRAFGAALRRAATLDEIDVDDVESRSHLLLGMVLGLNIAARGGASASELAGIVAATRKQVLDWRLLR